jgi:hypothetical protein
MPEKDSGPSRDAGAEEQIAHYIAEYRRLYADLNPTDEVIEEWLRYDGILAAEVTDEELLDLFTDEEDETSSMEYEFVVRGPIDCWMPSEGGISYCKISDGGLKAALRDYLGRQGRRFERWGDVLPWAEEHNWPRIDALHDALALETAKDEILAAKMAAKNG